jgi:hypothetical protein
MVRIITIVVMDSLEDAFAVDRALVFGIGGSGDVVGTIPTARLLESHGVSVTLGGIAWEPTPRDPVIGPRSLGELTSFEQVNETVALVTGDTQTTDGIGFSETIVADFYDEEVVLLDITQGVDGMITGLNEACDTLGFDLVIGTDSGGDVLATGTEAGLRSPVSDGLGIVALSDLAYPSFIGMLGYGSDGELTRPQLDAALARVASNDGLLGAWGLTKRIRDELDELVTHVPTEASRLPVEAAHGEIGTKTIRNGTVTLELTPPSIVTFYFTPTSVRSYSTIAQIVAEHRSLEAIQAAFEDRGIVTEFEREAARLEQS